MPGTVIQAAVPSQCGVVIVGAGVDKIPGLVVVKQMRIVWAAVEAKLHHRHPWQSEAMTKFFHIVADDAEIFGHQG